MEYAPSALNTDKPNVARVRDALLGGHGNYHADREEAERLAGICPELRAAARENRAFIARALTWAARQGVSQFIDLGTGMPAHPSAGDAARAVVPDARIAYVDHDPFVIVHAAALLAADKGIAAVDADLADPASVLADPELLRVIDPAEPVCAVLGLVLSLMPARQAREVVAGWADLVAPGSCVVISCGRCDDEALWVKLREACTSADVYNHAPAEVAGFLAGLEPVPPGIAPAQSWRGGWHDAPAIPPGPAYALAGVARKL